MLDIGIPYYGQIDYLARTIQSIKENAFYPYRILLYDDGTPARMNRDILFEALHSRDQDTGELLGVENYVIRHGSQNHGVAYAFNELLDMSSARFVCLMNSDVYCFKWWDKYLIDYLALRDDVGCVGPSTNYAANEQCILPHGLPLEKAIEWYKHRTETQYHKEVKSVIGFCMAFRRILFNKIGWFDERFCPAQWEETEWQWRATKAGYKHFWVPDSFVYHFGSKTLKESGSRFINETFRHGKEIFERKQRDEIIGEICHLKKDN